MENKEKKGLSNTAKIGIGIGIIMLVFTVSYIAYTNGYNKGFDKGTGWQ